ncbi:MAG: hypothetical protein A3C47_07135 [Omnitrophica bacterium RIFCSPHIGHO2_02_FULL_51_18]|nr:MAG: hypothetical protein A3C47_07135 [Omnitrophica bacterium RIFCSPHIGHO2_02_FULL_51_18]
MVKPLKSKVRRRNLSPIFSVKFLGGFKSFLLSSLPYILSLTVLGVLFGTVAVYAVNSPSFRLEEVRVLNIGSLAAEQAFKFCELQKGENLVTLDLVNVQELIKRKHPEFKEVRVRRVLPNRIEVLLKRRTPIAQIAFSSRYVQVDKSLVVLPGTASSPFRNLTILEGVPVPPEGLLVGASLREAGTLKALKLAEYIKGHRLLRKHTLSRIDISDPRNISVYVDGDIEIRLGFTHLVERLKILDQTLKTVELDRVKIRYIDLRFDDVVIGPR